MENYLKIALLFWLLLQVSKCVLAWLVLLLGKKRCKALIYSLDAREFTLERKRFSLLTKSPDNHVFWIQILNECMTCKFSIPFLFPQKNSFMLSPVLILSNTDIWQIGEESNEIASINLVIKEDMDLLQCNGKQ